MASHEGAAIQSIVGGVLIGIGCIAGYFLDRRRGYLIVAGIVGFLGVLHSLEAAAVSKWLAKSGFGKSGLKL